MKSKLFRAVLVNCVCLVCFSALAQNNGESFETIIKRAMSQGVLKREGNALIYMASPAQDTGKIRGYYEDLIKKAGSPFVFRFDNPPVVKQPAGPEKAPAVVVQQVPTTQINTNIKPGVVDQHSGGFTHQNVFGQLHYTDRVENYTWTVPDGVSQIWIECWSGGGHGRSTFEKAPTDTNQILLVRGGGGGGGAYASTMLSVQKGERILITIPPGGGAGTLEIMLNDKNNVMYLKNGGNGNWEDELNGKGRGGVSGGNFGRFTNDNVFWVSGQSGGVVSEASYRYQASTRQAFGQNTASFNEMSIGNFGNGGAAAYMNNGGRGGKLADAPFGGYASGQNGGFPGGGGGGGELGFNNYGGWYGPGRGAPGVVIIHF